MALCANLFRKSERTNKKGKTYTHRYRLELCCAQLAGTEGRNDCKSAYHTAGIVIHTANRIKPTLFAPC